MLDPDRPERHRERAHRCAWHATQIEICRLLDADWTLLVEGFEDPRSHHARRANGAAIERPERLVRKELLDAAFAPGGDRVFVATFDANFRGEVPRDVGRRSPSIVVFALDPRSGRERRLLVRIRNRPPGPALVDRVLLLATRALRESPADLGRDVDARAARRRDEFPEIVGSSAAINRALREMSAFAGTSAPVVIHGESGTGKELFARAIHRASPWAAGPFIAENCGAIPETLVESELFGHERGAFTGAFREHVGLVERAAGGTLFLDEIAEMTAPLQTRFLRVLQESEIRRVGATHPTAVKFRLVCATHRDLEKLVETGEFRHDLFFRLHVAHLRLPSLRERPEDIPELLQHFNTLHARAANRDPVRILPDALEHLRDYAWPGNIRELSNEVFRLVSCGHRVVDARALSPRVLRRSAPAAEAIVPLDELERRVIGAAIRRALELCSGNRTQAAERLGVSRQTLLRRMRRHGISGASRA